MVWKPTLFVAETMALKNRTSIKGFITFDGFVREVFGYFNDFSNSAFFKDPRDVFKLGNFLDSEHFPKHIMFANFQCLRCGLCCKNHDCVQVADELIRDWQIEERCDILSYVDSELCEIQSSSGNGCPFCRKVKSKPYFACKIHPFKDRIVDCRPYLCSKSLPVSHINFRDVDELIEVLGLEEYYGLIEKDWGEIFDYSKSAIKTHKPIKKLAANE